MPVHKELNGNLKKPHSSAQGRMSSAEIAEAAPDVPQASPPAPGLSPPSSPIEIEYPANSPAVSVPHRRLDMTPQQRRARGRRSLRRRTNAAPGHSNATTAQILLRAHQDHLNFERERWEREDERERCRTALRERELVIREKELQFKAIQIEIMKQIGNRVLDLVESYINTL